MVTFILIMISVMNMDHSGLDNALKIGAIIDMALCITMGLIGNRTTKTNNNVNIHIE